VDGRVLIPRPETEHLVDEALSWLVRRGLPAPRVADVCTGSGCIAVSVAVEVPGAHVVATDRSKDALAVAEDNAQTLAPGAGIAFRHGDLLAALDGQAPFDLLLSNPPYIPDSEIAALDTDVRDFEPRAALASGQSAVTFHRRLLREGPAWIVPGGAMMMELPAGGAEVLEPDLLSDWSGRWKVVRDYAGIPRVLEVFVPGT
jgi:release factor glutamine methyltransferase